MILIKGLPNFRRKHICITFCILAFVDEKLSRHDFELLILGMDRWVYLLVLHH